MYNRLTVGYDNLLRIILVLLSDMLLQYLPLTHRLLDSTF